MSTAELTGDETARTNPLTELTAFQRDLLIAIEDVEQNGTTREHVMAEQYDHPSGQCVKKRVEDYGYGPQNHGRLYPNLDTLVNKGLVEKVEIDRRTNAYTPTEEGQQALEGYREFVGGGN